MTTLSNGNWTLPDDIKQTMDRLHDESIKEYYRNEDGLTCQCMDCMEWVKEVKDHKGTNLCEKCDVIWSQQETEELANDNHSDNE